ncbi:MAG: alpha/beta hydrolase [Paraclostridium bifermentans]|jgi:monoterpene epsilon-lactone hydrolase|uniref:alpha/beta hydrolase n=1 Tax=Paraclostridium bifermentans TaxID=1490 RepID=UPI0011DDFF16|nr:alpha/beta hydrolase [Paraclostridium bifermentans]MBS6508558.1 alpha/beta hydrolase [Paraclostridium bifermentans]MDU3803038.1 alpha/beta hydrolase [Paraclostridium bifermentans]
MEQERNNSDENIKFSHIKYNSELENMYFSDSDFITCFRNFMDESLNQSLKDLKQDYSLNEVDIKGIKAAWIESLNSIKNKGVIIYLHGGCYIYGNINNYCTIPVQISNTTGLKVLSVNYSLAPENPFPKAIEDVQNIYEYLIEEGYTSDQIVIVGDSAGGGLALATVIKLRDLKVDLPAALGLFSPWVDLTLKGDTIETLKDFDNVLSKRQLEGAAKIYAEKQELTNPLISPVFADLKNCPPMMILAGGREILLSDSINLARRANLDNTIVNFIVWDKLDHVFAVDSTLPESKEAIEILGKFLLEKMNYK